MLSSLQKSLILTYRVYLFSFLLLNIWLFFLAAIPFWLPLASISLSVLIIAGSNILSLFRVLSCIYGLVGLQLFGGLWWIYVSESDIALHQSVLYLTLLSVLFSVFSDRLPALIFFFASLLVGSLSIGVLSGAYSWWIYLLPAFWSPVLKYIFLLPSTNQEWQESFSEYVHQSVYLESPEALFVVDELSRTIVDCNPAALKMFDADKISQLEGRFGEDLQVVPLTFAQKTAIETNDFSIPLEIEYLSLKGRRFWGNLSFYHTTYNQNTFSIVRVADITVQKQALSRLNHSEAIFTLLDDATPITIWMADADMIAQLLELNIEFWPSQAVFDKDVSKKNALFGLLARIHQDDKDIFYQVLVRAIRKKEEFRLELRMKDPQGIWRWMLSTGTPRFGPDSDTNQGYIGCFLDINDRFELKYELDRHFSLSLDAIVVVGCDGFLIRHNPAFTALLGYSTDIFMSRAFASFFDPQDQHQLSTHWNLLLDGHTLTNLEIRAIDADGNQKWLLLKAMPNIDKEQIFFVIQDNTQAFVAKKQRIELLDQIKYVNALLDTLFTETPVGLCYFDLEGNYMRINKSLAQMNGRSVEDHEGKNIYQIAPDVADLVMKDIRQVAQKGPIMPHTMERYRNGNDKWPSYFSVSYFQIRVQDELIGVGLSVIEISAIKHAQMEVEILNQQLSQQTVLLDNILLTIPDLIVLSDMSGVITYINDAVCKFTGQSKEFLLSGINCKQAGFPEDFYQQLSQQALLLKENSLSQVDGLMDVDKGSNQEKNYEYTLLALNDKDNNPQAMLATIRDVSERRLSEQQILDNQNQLNQIIDLLPQPIYMLDQAGNIRMANASYAALCGLPVNQLINQPVASLIHFADSNHDSGQNHNSGHILATDAHEDKTNNATLVWEATIQTNLGQQNIYQVCKQDFLSFSNQEAMVLYVAVDLTPLKILQQNLQDREAFLQEIVQTVPQAIFIKDAQGRYLLVNRAYEQIYKREASQIINFTDYDFNPDHIAADRFAEINRRVLEDNQSFEGEDYYLEPNGEKRYFHVIKKPFAMGSAPESRLLLGVINDITAVKKLHLEIQYNEDFLRQVINLVPHGIFIKNIEGKFTLVNTAFASLLRTNTIDLSQISLEDLFPAEIDLIERLKKSDAHVFQTNTTQASYEQVWDPVEQKVRYFQITRRPTRFKPQGNMLLLGVIVETTDLRKMETTIKQNFDTLRKVIDALPIAIFIKDIEGKLILANRHYAYIHNQPLEQLVGRYDSDYLDIETLNKIRQEDHQIIEKKQNRVFENICFNKKLGQARLCVIGKTAIQLEAEGPWLMLGYASDITDIRQLMFEKQRFFSHSPDIILLTDSQGNTFEVSPAVKAILGYEPEEFVDLPFIGLVHPDDIEKTHNAIKCVMEGSNLENFENRYKHKDGHWEWLLWSSTMIKETGMVCSTARQITHYKKLQNQTESVSNKLTNLVESIENDFFAVDNELKIVFVKRIKGKKVDSIQDSFIGQNIFEIVQVEPNSKFVQGLHQVMKTGRSMTLTDYNPIEKTWFEATLHPYINGGVSVLYADINQKMYWKQRAFLLEQAVLTMKDSVVIAELGPDSTKPFSSKIVFVNPACCKRYDFEADQVIGLPPDKFLISDNLDQTTQIIRDALHKGEPVRTELTVKNIGPEPIFVDVNIIPISNQDGKYTHWIAVMTDISEQKNTELSLRSSLQNKSLMLQEVHHRIQNNLQIVISLLQFHARETTDAMSIELIRKSQNRIKSIALLHQTLYKLNKADSTFVLQYMSQLCQQILETYKQEGRLVQIHIDGLEVEINMDIAIPLGLIINEIITNSCKHAFLPSQTDCLITLFVSSDEHQQNLCIDIYDNGKGIATISDAQQDNERKNSIGTMLINMLADQIKAKLVPICPDGIGAGYRIDIPLMIPNSIEKN